MKKLIEFFLKTGDIKRAKQQGFVLREVKDPSTVGGHSFREAIMGWILAGAENTGLDEDRLIKLTLCHDLIAGYAGDITPYDPIISKYKGKNLKEMYTKWVRLPQADKKKFYRRQSNQEQGALRKLTAAISRTNTTVIFTNQIRMKIGTAAMYGNPETTPGGNALKFYASVRIEIRRAAKILKGEEVIGSRTKAKVVKNKVAPPFRTAEFDIMYNHGISYEGDIITLGAKYGLVKKSGASFAYGDIKLGQGMENAKSYLKENKKTADEIIREIKKLVVEL